MAGIGQALQEKGSSWASVLPGLHLSEYTLESIDSVVPFLDDDVPAWRADLAGASPTSGEPGAPDGRDLARPARTLGSPFTAPTDGSVGSSVVLDAGGAAFFDVLPGSSLNGIVELAVEYPSGVTAPDIAVQMIPFTEYPQTCASATGMEIDENQGVFRGTVAIHIGDDCSFVSVVITNRSVTETSPVITWTATYVEDGPTYAANLLSDPGAELHLADTGGGPLGFEVPALYRVFGEPPPPRLEWSDGSPAPETSHFMYSVAESRAVVLPHEPLTGSQHIQLPPASFPELLLTERKALVPDSSSLGTVYGGHYTAQILPGDEYTFTVHAREVTGSSLEDDEIGIGLVFYDPAVDYLYQVYRKFETFTDYRAYSISGVAYSTELYVMAFVENRMRDLDGVSINVDEMSLSVGVCPEPVRFGSGLIRDGSFDDLVYANGDDGGIPWFTDATYSTLDNEYGADADLESTSWANAFTTTAATRWDISYNNPTDGFAHARVETASPPAPLVIADASACSDGTSYSARAVGGGDVEVSFDIASSPVPNGSAWVSVTYTAYGEDGSPLGSSNGTAMPVASTYNRVSAAWTPPTGTYWVRAAIEVTGNNGGDPIIWRIDRADMAVSP